VAAQRPAFFAAALMIHTTRVESFAQKNVTLQASMPGKKLRLQSKKRRLIRSRVPIAVSFSGAAKQAAKQLALHLVRAP
jgi:hypothetical protein